MRKYEMENFNLLFMLFLILSINVSQLEIELHNIDNEEYYGLIKIDGLDYPVLFDTGSNISWVEDANASINSIWKSSKSFLKTQNNSEVLYTVQYKSGSIAIRENRGNLKIGEVYFKDFIYGTCLIKDNNMFKNVISYVNLRQ